jgi:hypothetical protein
MLPEDGVPAPAIPRSVNGSEEAVTIRKWHVNRVFIFLTATTAACMAAVAAAPNPAVLGAVAAIWAGSVILAMFLLGGTYRDGRLAEFLALVDRPRVAGIGPNQRRATGGK